MSTKMMIQRLAVMLACIVSMIVAACLPMSREAMQHAACASVGFVCLHAFICHGIEAYRSHKARKALHREARELLTRYC